MANTDPVEFRLYDVDTITQLGIIAHEDGRFHPILNEPGSGNVSFLMDSTLARLVESGQYVDISYRGASRGGFLIENITRNIANPQEGGGRIISVSGRGAMALLDDAIVWDDNRGDTNRSFTGTQAAVLIQLIEEAQLRGALQNITYDFTATEDSNSVSWTDSAGAELTVGTTLLDFVREMTLLDIDFQMLPDGAGNFVLSAYSGGIGTNKASTIYFRVGRNCQEVGGSEVGLRIKNALNIKYKSGFVEVTDSASITARRRREKSVTIENAGTSSAAQTWGAAEVALAKNPEYQVSVKLYDGLAPISYIDYILGDTVTLDTLGEENAYRIRGIDYHFGEKDYAEIVIDFNSLILENEIRLTRDVNWLMNNWKRAHDANLLEVSYWAAIGNPDIGYSGRQVLIVGANLYAFSSDSLLIYSITSGGWTRVLLGRTPFQMTNVGNDIYIGCSKAVLRYSGGAITDTWVVANSSNPLQEWAYNIVAVGTDVYCAGIYDDIDSVAMTGVAKLDTLTDSWSDIAGGTSAASGGAAFATDGSVLYASFGSSGVRSYNGSWTTLGTNPGTVLCLATYGTDLLAGTSDGDHIYIWDGASWEIFGGGISGAVYAIAPYLTDVYVGGTFTDEGNNITVRRGEEWQELAEGVNDKVSWIALYDDDVYVSGNFTEAGDAKPALNLAVYFTNFEALMDYLENSSSSFNLAEAIHNATAKTTMTGADEFGMWDSITGLLRKITWSNILLSIKTYTDGLYVALTGNQSIAGVKTFTSDPVIPDEAYDATAWNGSLEPPTKNAVRDKIEAMGAGTPAGSDTEIQYNNAGAFGASSNFVRNSDGSIAIGGAPATTSTAYGIFQRADAVSVANLLTSFGSSVASYIAGIRARGTYASPTAVLLGDILLRIRGRGHDGTTYGNTSAEIRLLTTEDHDVTDHGTNIELYATPTGSTTLTKILTVEGDGNLNIEAGQEYQVGGAQHQHVIADITDYSGGGGGAFQRVLSANITLADGESLVMVGYLDDGGFDVIFEGDSELEVL